MYRFLDRDLADMDGASRLMVSAMRSWVHAAQAGRCACSSLRPQFAAAGIGAALGDFAMMMHLLNREGLGKLHFGVPGSCRATDDEARLLALISAAVCGEAGLLNRLSVQYVAEPHRLNLEIALDRIATALWNAPAANGLFASGPKDQDQ